MERLSFDKTRERISQQLAHAQQKKKRLQAEEARYTLVLHAARKQLGLTINEYCLADTIHKLSGNRSVVPGWCHASKEHLAKSFGFSRRSIHNILNQLKKKKIIEVSEETSYLRATELWRETVEVIKDRAFRE